mgnify:FL=1
MFLFSLDFARFHPTQSPISSFVAGLRLSAFNKAVKGMYNPGAYRTPWQNDNQ